MKIQENNNVENNLTFTAKKIIEHKMPKINTDKFETRSVRLNGKFVKTYSRNNGTYFIVGGTNYYVDDAMFKYFNKFKKVV